MPFIVCCVQSVGNVNVQHFIQLNAFSMKASCNKHGSTACELITSCSVCVSHTAIVFSAYQKLQLSQFLSMHFNASWTNKRRWQRSAKRPVNVTCIGRPVRRMGSPLFWFPYWLKTSQLYIRARKCKSHKSSKLKLHAF